MAPSWAATAVLAALLTAATIAAPLSINAGSTTGTVTLPAGTYDYVTVTNVNGRVVVGTNVVSNGAFTIQGTSTTANMNAAQISLTNCRASVMTIGYISGTAASLKLQGVRVTGITRLYGVTSSADVVSVKQSTLGPLTLGSMRGVRNGFVMSGNTVTCSSSTSCVYLQGYLMGTATVAGFDITGNTITASYPSTSTTYYGLNFGASQAAKMVIDDNKVTMTRGRSLCINFAGLTSLSSVAPLQLAITHNELRAKNTTGTTYSVTGIAFPGVSQSSGRPPIEIQVQHNVIEALSNSQSTYGVYMYSTMTNVKLNIGDNQITAATMSGSAYATYMYYGFRLSPLLNISGNALTIRAYSGNVYGIFLPSLASSSTSSAYGVRNVTQVLLNGNTMDLTVARRTSYQVQGVYLYQMRGVDSLQVSGNTIGMSAGSTYGLFLQMYTYSEVKAVQVNDNTITADCSNGAAMRVYTYGTQSFDVKGNTATFERITTSSIIAVQVQFRGWQTTRSTNAVAIQNNALRGVTGGTLVHITYLSQFNTLDLGGNQWAAAPAAQLTSGNHMMYYLASVYYGSRIRFADERIGVCSSAAVCGYAYGIQIGGGFSYVDSLVFDNVDFGVYGYRRGVGIYITSSFTTVRAVSVKNCRFDVKATYASSTSTSYYTAGLLMQGLMSNLDALEVVNNTVTGSNVPVGGGLLVGASVNTQLRSITRLAITGNTVTMTSPYSSLTGVRLMGRLQNVSSTSVADNTITLTQTTGSGTIIGLYTYTMLYYTPSPLELLRNSITVTARTNAYGMQTLFSSLLDAKGVYIADSNVSATTTYSTSARTFAIQFGSISRMPVVAVTGNNLMVNGRGATSSSTYVYSGAVYLSSTFSNIGVFNVSRNTMTVKATTSAAVAGYRYTYITTVGLMFFDENTIEVDATTSSTSGYYCYGVWFTTAYNMGGLNFTNNDLTMKGCRYQYSVSFSSWATRTTSADPATITGIFVKGNRFINRDAKSADYGALFPTVSPYDYKAFEYTDNTLEQHSLLTSCSNGLRGGAAGDTTHSASTLLYMRNNLYANCKGSTQAGTVYNVMYVSNVTIAQNNITQYGSAPRGLTLTTARYGETLSFIDNTAVLRGSTSAHTFTISGTVSNWADSVVILGNTATYTLTSTSRYISGSGLQAAASFSQIGSLFITANEVSTQGYGQAINVGRIDKTTHVHVWNNRVTATRVQYSSMDLLRFAGTMSYITTLRVSDNTLEALSASNTYSIRGIYFDEDVSHVAAIAVVRNKVDVRGSAVTGIIFGDYFTNTTNGSTTVLPPPFDPVPLSNGTLVNHTMVHFNDTDIGTVKIDDNEVNVYSTTTSYGVGALSRLKDVTLWSVKRNVIKALPGCRYLYAICANSMDNVDLALITANVVDVHATYNSYGMYTTSTSLRNKGGFLFTDNDVYLKGSYNTLGTFPGQQSSSTAWTNVTGNRFTSRSTSYQRGVCIEQYSRQSAGLYVSNNTIDSRSTSTSSNGGNYAAVFLGSTISQVGLVFIGGNNITWWLSGSYSSAVMIYSAVYTVDSWIIEDNEMYTGGPRYNAYGVYFRSTTWGGVGTLSVRRNNITTVEGSGSTHTTGVYGTSQMKAERVYIEDNNFTLSLPSGTLIGIFLHMYDCKTYVMQRNTAILRASLRTSTYSATGFGTYAYGYPTSSSSYRTPRPGSSVVVQENSVVLDALTGYGMRLYVRNMQSSTLRQNTVRTVKPWRNYNTGSLYGIQLNGAYYCGAVAIEDNDIVVSSRSVFGVYLSTVQYITGDFTLQRNRFSANGTYTAIGIYTGTTLSAYRSLLVDNTITATSREFTSTSSSSSYYPATTIGIWFQQYLRTAKLVNVSGNAIDANSTAGEIGGIASYSTSSSSYIVNDVSALVFSNNDITAKGFRGGRTYALTTIGMRFDLAFDNVSTVNVTGNTVTFDTWTVSYSGVGFRFAPYRAVDVKYVYFQRNTLQGKAGTVGMGIGNTRPFSGIVEALYEHNTCNVAGVRNADQYCVSASAQGPATGTVSNLTARTGTITVRYTTVTVPAGTTALQGGGGLVYISSSAYLASIHVHDNTADTTGYRSSGIFGATMSYVRSLVFERNTIKGSSMYFCRGVYPGGVSYAESVKIRDNTVDCQVTTTSTSTSYAARAGGIGTLSYVGSFDVNDNTFRAKSAGSEASAFLMGGFSSRKFGNGDVTLRRNSFVATGNGVSYGFRSTTTWTGFGVLDIQGNTFHATSTRTTAAAINTVTMENGRAILIKDTAPFAESTNSNAYGIQMGQFTNVTDTVMQNLTVRAKGVTVYGIYVPTVTGSCEYYTLRNNSVDVVARGQAYGLNFATTSAAGVSGTVVENVVNVQGTTSTGNGLQVGLYGPSSGANGTLLVQRNNVTVTMTTGSATGLGIQRTYYLTNFLIEDNIVHAAGGSTLNGLYMGRWYHCYTGVIQRNQITTRHTNQQNRYGRTYGLYVGSSTYAMRNVELLENTIDVEGASTYTVSGIHFGSSIRYAGNWTWRGNNVTVANRYRYSVTSYYSGSAYAVYFNGYLQHMGLLQLQGNTFTTLAGSVAYGVYMYYSSSSSSFRSNVSELAIIDNAFYQGCVVARTSPSATTYGVNTNMLMRDIGAFTVTGNLFTNVFPQDSPFGTNPAVMRSSSAIGFGISRTMYNVSFDISNNTVELYARSTVTGIITNFYTTSRELRVRNNTLRLHSTLSSVYAVRMGASGDSSRRFGGMLVDRNTMDLECAGSATAVSVTGSYFGSVNVTDNAVVAARSPKASTSSLTAFYGVTVGGATYCKHLRLEGNHMDGTGVVYGRGVYFGSYSYAGVLVHANTFLISSPALAARSSSLSTAMQISSVSRSDTVISNNTFTIYGGISTGLSVTSTISYGSYHVHENQIQLFTMYPSRPRSYGMTFSYITSTDAFVVSNNIVTLRAQLLSGADMPFASQPYTAIGVYFDNDVDQNKAVGVVSNTIDVLCGRYAVSGIELGDTVDHVYNKTLNHTLYNITGDGTLSFSDNTINVRTPTTSVTHGVRFTSSIRYIAQGLVVSGNRMTCNNSATGGFHGVSIYGSTLATVALLEVAGNTVDSHVATSYGVYVRSSMTSVFAQVKNNRLTHYRRARTYSTVYGVYFTGWQTSCTVEVVGNTIDAAATETDRCTGRGVAFTGSIIRTSRYHIAGNNITHASPAATFFHGFYFGGTSTDTDNLYNVTGNTVTIMAQRAAAGVLTQRRFGLRTTVEISSNTMAVTTVWDNAVGIRIEGELEDTLIIAQNKLASTAKLTSAFGIVVAALGRKSSTPRSSGVPAPTQGPTAPGPSFAARGVTAQWTPDEWYDDNPHLGRPSLLAAGSVWIVASNEVMSRGTGSAAFTVSTQTLDKVNIVAEGNRFAADGPRDPQPSTTARVWTAPVQVNTTRLTTALVWFQKNIIAAINKTAADCVLQLPEAMGTVNATLRANKFLERETPLLMARSIAAPVSLPVDFAFVCNYFGGEPLVNRSLVEPRLPTGATLVMRRECDYTGTVSPRVAHSATATLPVRVPTPTQTQAMPRTRTSTVAENDSSSSSSSAAASSMASESSLSPPPPVMSASSSSSAHGVVSSAASSTSAAHPASSLSAASASSSSATPVTTAPATQAPSADEASSSSSSSTRKSQPTAVSSSSGVAPSSHPTTAAPTMAPATSSGSTPVTTAPTAASASAASSGTTAPTTAAPTVDSSSGSSPTTPAPTTVPSTPVPGASSSPASPAPAADSSSGPTTPAPLTPAPAVPSSLSTAAPTTAPAASSSAPAAPSSASSATTPAPTAPTTAPTASSSNSASAPTTAPATTAPATPTDSSQGSASSGDTAAPTPEPSPAPTPEPSPAPTPAPERTLTIQVTPPPVLPAAVTESAEAIGTTLAGAGALLASPAAAAQLARAVAVLDLAELCGNGQLPHVSKLSFSSSPLGLGIGPDIGRYYRGAVIGNIVLGLVLTAVVSLAVFITSKLPCAINAPRHPSGDPHSPWLRACGFWRYPSCLVVGLAFLLDGTVYGALAGALHGDPSSKGLDMALCAVVMLGLVALFAGLGYFHVRGPTTHVVHFVPEERDLKASLPRRTALFFGGAHGHWLVRPTSLSPDDSSRQRMWALLFTWYRAPMHRFLLIDLGATALIAILRSIPPDHCVSIVWGITAINVAVLAAAAAMRPYNVPLKTMLLVGTCVVTVAASVFVAIALREDPATEGLITAAADLAVIAMYLIVINVIVSVVRHIYKKIRSCTSKDPRRVNALFANELEAELRAHSDLVGVRDDTHMLVDGSEDLLAATNRESRDSDSNAPRDELFSPKPLNLNLGAGDDGPAAVLGGGRRMTGSFALGRRKSLIARGDCTGSDSDAPPTGLQSVLGSTLRSPPSAASAPGLPVQEAASAASRRSSSRRDDLSSGSGSDDLSNTGNSAYRPPSALAVGGAKRAGSVTSPQSAGAPPSAVLSPIVAPSSASAPSRRGSLWSSDDEDDDVLATTSEDDDAPLGRSRNATMVSRGSVSLAGGSALGGPLSPPTRPSRGDDLSDDFGSDDDDL